MAELPRTIAEMRTALAGIRSEEGARRATCFVPDASDVFIATFPKCGTTWVQQIVHSLRTMGDMDFSEITAVVPWLEMAYDLGIDPNAAQRGFPRAFKTHYDGDAVPKGARYIYVVRDPADVLVSFFRFFEGWYFEPGSISIEEFANEFYFEGTGSGRYWSHVVSWWPKVGKSDTLAMTYEAMKDDSARAVERIADFIGHGNDRSRIETAIEHSSFEFMRAHEAQFDDHLIRQARNPACGLPATAGSSKIREGKVGSHRSSLSRDVLDRLGQKWGRQIETELGFPDYAALRSHIDKLSSGSS